VAEQPVVIIQVPRGSAIERQLRVAPPPAISGHDVLVQTAPTDDEGNLEELPGEVVLSLPAPAELLRQADEVQRVLRRPGTGAAPLVIVIEAAEELQEDQAALVVEAARHAPRPVILRVVRPSEL
jgi:hypothetical protein